MLQKFVTINLISLITAIYWKVPTEKNLYRKKYNNEASKFEYLEALETNYNSTLTISFYRDGVNAYNLDPDCTDEFLPNNYKKSDNFLKFSIASVVFASDDQPIINSKIKEIILSQEKKNDSNIKLAKSARNSEVVKKRSARDISEEQETKDSEISIKTDPNSNFSSNNIKIFIYFCDNPPQMLQRSVLTKLKNNFNDFRLKNLPDLENNDTVVEVKLLNKNNGNQFWRDIAMIAEIEQEGVDLL